MTLPVGSVNAGSTVAMAVDVDTAALIAEYALPAGDGFAAAGQHGTANSRGTPVMTHSACAATAAAPQAGQWAPARTGSQLGLALDLARPNGDGGQVPAQAAFVMAESTALLAWRISMPIVICEKP